MSDSEGEEKSSFTVPRYKGNYVEFEPQLLAYATLKGCDVAYDPDEEADYFPWGEGVYTDNEAIKKKQKNFVKKNLHAIVVLNQAFAKHSQLLSLVRNSKNEAWPKGRAWWVMNALRQKFLPRDGLSHFDAEKDLSEVVMQGNEDPIEFYERLVNVKFQYEGVLTNREIQSQFLKGCSSTYKSSILQIYRDQPSISIEDLALKLQIDYRLSGALDSHLALDNESIEHETLLAQPESPQAARHNATGSTRPVFSDANKICHLCGQRGHVMRNCPNAATQPPLRCDLCNRFGHPRAYCWEDEKNAHRRPEGWRSILPATTANDEEAHLMSFNLMTYEHDPRSKNKSDCSLMETNENDKCNDDECTDDESESDIVIEPLPLSGVAYANPRVYASPTSGTTSREAIIIDSSDDDMTFEYDSDESFRTDDAESAATSTDNDMMSVTGELDRLSPAFKDTDGTSDKPINLASSSDGDVGRNHASRLRQGQLFSDTSDESKPMKDAGPSDDEDSSIKSDASDDSGYQGDIIADVPDIDPYPYDLMLHPDVFVFTGRAMNFNERPMDADAAQRSFNHFYLEEQITRNIRLARLEQDSTLGDSNSSHDPALVAVMSFMCPTYASAIKQALESGLDEDAVGIFSYETDNDDNNQENEQPNVRRQLPPPDYGLAVIDYSLHDLKGSNLFVLDTGASNHGTTDDKGCIKVRRRSSNEVYSNNGSAMKIAKRYDRKGIVYNRNDEPVSMITMMGVNHTPSSSFNLFSVSHCLRKGWTLHGDFNGFTLTKGSSTIAFNIRIKSGSGYLWAAKIVPCEALEGPMEVTNTACEANNDSNSENDNSSNHDSDDDDYDRKPSASRNQVVKNTSVIPGNSAGRPISHGMTKEYAHVLMGHAYVKSAVEVAKYLGFRMCTDKKNCRQIVVCEGCARGKARRTGVNIHGTTTHQKASAPNLFVFLDITTIREAGGQKVRNGVWVGMVDEFSGMATSMFIATKGALAESACKLLSDWKQKGKNVHTIRCDNATENKALMRRAMAAVWQLSLRFEFTSVGTP